MLKHDVVGGALFTPDLKRVLLLQRAHYRTFWPGEWYFLSEHKEPLESDLDALKRGCVEELGLDGIVQVGAPINLQGLVCNGHIFDFRLYPCILPPGQILLNKENEAFVWHDVSRLANGYPSVESRGDLLSLAVRNVQQLKQKKYF